MPPLALLAAVTLGVLPYTWHALPLDGGGRVSCLAVSPHNSALVLAGGDQSGVHLSLDGGRTWQPASLGLDHDAQAAVADIAFHPADPRLVYLAAGRLDGPPIGDYGALMISGDGGRSWSLRSQGVRFSGAGGHRQRGRLLAVDPFQRDALWAATAWDGVMESRDRGATWRRLGPEATFISALARTADGTLYAAAEATPKRRGGLLALVPGADAWRLVYQGPVIDVAAAPSEPGRLLLTTPDAGLVLTEDAGATWVNVTPAGFSERLRAQTAVFSPSHPQVGVAVGEPRPGRPRLPTAYLTLDGGRTWQPLLERPEEAVTTGTWWLGPELFGFEATRAAFDPRSPRRLWLGSAVGVWATHDGAASWFAGHVGLRNSSVAALVLDPARPDGVCVGLERGGAFRLSALAPAPLPLGGNLLVVDDVSSLAVGPAAEGVLAALGRRVWAHQPPANWTAGAAEARGPIRSLVWLGDQTLLAAVEGQPLQASDDRGGTWRLWGQPPAVGGRPLALRQPLCLDALGRSVAAFHPQHGVFFTDDAGQTWRLAAEGLPDIDQAGERHKHLLELAVQPGDRPRVYAGNATGVWRTLDRGASWDRVFPRRASAIGVDPGTGRLYVADGSLGMLYCSDDAGEGWDEIAFEGSFRKTIDRLLPDPRHFGRVWVALRGNGLVLGEPTSVPVRAN